MTSEAEPLYDEHNIAPLLILMRARGLYADLCDEFERADPADNEYCLLLSNCANDLAAFISGMDRLMGVKL